MKINGSLIFDASSASEIQNLRVQKVSSNPTHTAADVGRLIYNTGDNVIYIGGASAWVALATGGNATALQTEVDALETSLGAIVGTTGVFVPGQVTGAAINAWKATHSNTDPANVTELFQALVNYASSVDSLDEILPGAAGQIIYNNAGSWNVALPGSTSGVQAYDAFLNSIAGLGTAADKMIYTTGEDTAAEADLTAFGRSLLDDADSAAGRTTLGVVIGTDVQAHDTGLDDIAALGPADGTIIVGNGTNWVAESSSTARASLGLTIGTDVQAFDTDLTQLAGFTPSAGDFIVGTGGVEGSRYQLLNGASARTALGLGDIATADQISFVKTNGTSTMTANLPMAGFKITGLGAGTTGTDAVNKNQLDAAVAGLSWKQAVRVATTANVDLSTDLENGDTIDGITLATGDRVLVKNQSAAADNGIYIVQASGAAVRSSDMDVAAEFSGATVFVAEGTANANSGWTQTSEVVTVGTTAVTFVQFTGSGTYTAGIGLDLTGNTFNVNLGAGIFELGTDAVGIELYSATGALILTEDGSARDNTNASKLHLKVKTTQLDQDATNGLFIKGSGVTETELATSVAGNGLSGGAGTALSVNIDDSSIEINADTLRVKAAGVTNTMLATGGLINLKASGSSDEPMYLGEDLNFAATSGTGVSIAVSTGNTVTIAGLDATTSTKGVASFSSSDFSVSAGVVSAVAKSIDSLTDVTLTSPTAGDVLVRNGSGQFVNQKAYFLYTGSSAATHTVTHNLGQKYCNVTVVDGSDEVVIPQSIKFDDANELIVTFNTAIACKVIVMGIA